jgi:hypothetical protein
MLDADGRRAVAIRGEGLVWYVGGHIVADDVLPRDRAPSRDDPATLGCLLALVREAWGDPAAHVAPYITWVRGPSGDFDERGWWLRLCRQDGCAYRYTDGDGVSTYLAGPTEWDALVAALAAAPGRAS